MMIDFLKTEIPKADLEIALRVLHKFKECESREEYIGIPFITWAKLEQLEEFLEFLVNDKPLANDSVEALMRREGTFTE